MAFSDNIWWTYKARIEAEKRLLSNALQSQILLLWYSFSGAAVSIYYLNSNNDTSATGLAGITWIVYSVLVLCMSGFISGLTFNKRAGLIKECYETLYSFYHKSKAKGADVDQLTAEYNQIIRLCENHTDKDYYLALCIIHVTQSGKTDVKTGLKEGLDRRPTWYHWCSVVIWTVKHYMMLFVLYSLPISLFVVLESFT